MSRVDFKTLVIGVLLGIIVMMARGASVQTAFVQRYQISAVPENGTTSIYVLDLKTNKVYHSTPYGGIDSIPAPFEIKTPDQ
jgi:hypothetical protein